MMEKIRAFICIDFPSEVIKEVARIQEIISKKPFVGKLTELENLHLTLKFLGEISLQKVDEARQALSKVKFPKLDLKLAYTGTFSHRKNPKIVWIKVVGNIAELQRQVDESLSGLFPKEERFMSHLTIARIKHVKSPEIFKDYVKKIKVKNLKFSVDGFKLKSSELRPDGPVYTTINECMLDG
jgi:RNA 2',3'-cyclic 3'-phosphodiesterase